LRQLKKLLKNQQLKKKVQKNNLTIKKLDHGS